MASALRLRKARREDAEFVLSLSNDPAVRAGSLRSGAIGREEHLKWFAARLADAGTIFYVVETAAGEPVGQIRFQRSEIGWNSSMSLLPQVRGRGLSAGLLHEALRKSGLKRVIGHVKLENERSYRMALKSGYADCGTATVDGSSCHVLEYADRTFVIAEMSANHRGDLGRAKDLVRAAAESGADAVKIQTYTADTMTLACDAPSFVVSGGTLWDGKRLHDVYRAAETPWSWTEDLMALAESLGIELFSTPFDRTSADYLEQAGVWRYKIASFEAVDIPLIRHVASKGRPMIISTGICTLDEIREVVAACRAEGNDDITLMKCTSAYPARPEDMDLAAIPDLLARFPGIRVGLSDHSLAPEVPVAAVALGASALEKHLTLDRPEGDAEASFALTPDEFAATVKAVRNTERSVGQAKYGASPAGRRFRRSLFVAADMKAGDPFTEENVRSVRPGDGCAPKLLPEILGRRAACDLRKGSPMRMDYVATT